MIMFSITKPKKKLKSIVTVVCMVLLLAVGVPVTYNCLKNADAMASFARVFHEDDVLYVTDNISAETDFAEIETESMTGDPIKVNAPDEKTAAETKNTETENKENTAENNRENNNNKEKSILDKFSEVIFGSPYEIIFYDTE